MAKLDDESLATWVRAGVDIDRLDPVPEDKALVYAWLWACLFRLAYPVLPVNPSRKLSICDKLAEYPYTLSGRRRHWAALTWRDRITESEKLIESRDEWRYAVHGLRVRVDHMHSLARRKELLSKHPKGKLREKRRAKADSDEHRDHGRKAKQIYEQDLNIVRGLVGDERAVEVLHYLYWHDKCN
jgi:hypothetical protein